MEYGVQTFSCEQLKEHGLGAILLAVHPLLFGEMHCIAVHLPQQTAHQLLFSLLRSVFLQSCSSCGTGDMLGEHGLDQLRRPSSTRSFDAMELAIIVAVQPHIPVTRTRPDPAGMAHE